MALTADNVRVGVTGAIYVADTGTALPTDADATPNVAFEDCGYVSDDGVTQTIDESRTDITAWQNSDIVRKIRTTHDLSYQFTLIETSDVSLETYYGNYTAGAIEISSDELPHKSWIVDVVDGDNTIRLVIPDGQITERGDVVYSNGEEVGYPITITAFPDASGVKAYKYVDAGGS